MALYLLYESASGYYLFHGYGLFEIGQELEAVRNSVPDLTRFSKIVKFEACHPFASTLDALNQCNAISEGIMTEELRNFLRMNLPKVKDGEPDRFSLGVSEPKLGSQIFEVAKIPCQSNDYVNELLRGIRLHFDQLYKDLKPADLELARLGLGHSYSRAKVKFYVNRVDNVVIQAICLLDTLDKVINSFLMRIREWYSWHFPELMKIVNDNYLYAKIAKLVQNKSDLSEDHILQLADILGGEDKAKEIVEVAKASMGQDLSPIDLTIVQQFAQRVMDLSEYRKKLYEYLVTKMNDISPNLTAPIGEVVGARLTSHAGSLTDLAKCPASTLQILSAEKALFRALKTQGNTPKYGLIFHSSFFGRASSRNKGRLARYLANKCSIASRIECFSESNTTAFGEKLHEQVEERLDFYEMDVVPRKNVEVMEAALESVLNDEMDVENEADDAYAKKSRKKKSKGESTDVDTMPNGDASAKPATEKKKKKKKDKSNQEHEAVTEADNAANEIDVENGADDAYAKKSKKKKSEGEFTDADTMEVDKSAVTNGDAFAEPATEKNKKKKKDKSYQEQEAVTEADNATNEMDVVNGVDDPSAKKSKKKKSKGESTNVDTMEVDKSAVTNGEASAEPATEKKKKKKKDKSNQQQKPVTEADNAADEMDVKNGADASTKKSKKKKSKGESADADTIEVDKSAVTDGDESAESATEKKKKKKKDKSNQEQEAVTEAENAANGESTDADTMDVDKSAVTNGHVSTEPATEKKEKKKKDNNKELDDQDAEQNRTAKKKKKDKHEVSDDGDDEMASEVKKKKKKKVRSEDDEYLFSHPFRLVS